jgi:hypothetical protein
MQDKIRSIQRDSSLSQIEKNTLISNILRDQNNQNRNLIAVKLKNECEHYKRNCSIISKCCGETFGCRLCHDEYADHKINRFDTEFIQCNKCHEKQSVSNNCVKCSTQFARYFCEICKFWNDAENINIFHCNKCGICIKGKKEEVIHCDNCELCVSNNHECFKTEFLKSDCPVCFESLHHSTKYIYSLPCSHIVHIDCAKNLQENRCPLCKKSIVSIDSTLIDNLIEMQPMPDEYKKEVTIHCNDCSQKSHVMFHFIGNKCLNCSSYNTTLA